MKKQLYVFWVLLFAVSPMFAQHVHPQPTVIDGSNTPERIADTHAQRHWLLVTASVPENLQGLSETDKLTAFSIILNFKVQYLQSIKTYNEQATASEKQGGRGGDTVAFQSQIDSLVAQTMQELASRLTLASYSTISARALVMKSNIRRAQ